MTDTNPCMTEGLRVTHLFPRTARALRATCATLLAAAVSATLALPAGAAVAAANAPAVQADSPQVVVAAAPFSPNTGPRSAGGCVGDGKAGKRVQVLYVRDPDTPDQFDQNRSTLMSSLHQTDDIFLKSAQVNGGGYRQVRWAHDANCEPVIQRLTIPPVTDTAGVVHRVHGPLMDDTVRTLRAAKVPIDDLTRKYVVFVEYPGEIFNDPVCGVAWGLYRDDTTPLASANRNNQGGSVGRIDSQCFVGSLDPDSYEETNAVAHELAHTMGAVLRNAPHATPSGHCSDNSDIMCYRDSTSGMIDQVCPLSQENILDCNGDDYFNTNPPAGSWLASNWNVASSEFLYQPEAPTARAPALAAGTSFVPGLPTTFTTPTPLVPSGQGWRLDYNVAAIATGNVPGTCVTGPLSGLSGAASTTTLQLRCAATTARVLTSAKVTQDDGRTSQSGGLTYAPTTTRPVTLTVTAGAATATPGAQTSLRVSAVDTATGQGIYGLPVHLSATSSAGTATLPTVTTDQNGAATASATVTSSTTFRGWTDPADQSVFETATSEQTVRVTTTTQLGMDTPATTLVSPGTVVTLTGRLTAGTSGLAGQQVSLWQTAPGAPAQAASATTDSAGRWRADVTVTADGTYQARFAGTPDLTASSSASLVLGATRPTDLSIALQASTVDPTQQAVVTGVLTSSGAALPGQTVTLWAGTDPAALSPVATGTTDATGTVRLSHAPTASGTYQLRFAGSAPYVAGASRPAAVTVRRGVTITPKVKTAAADPSRVVLGTPLRIDAEVTSGGVPVPGVALELWRTAPGAPVLMATGSSTDAAGRASVSIDATGDATYQLRTASTSEWAAGTSPSLPVVAVVASSVTLAASTTTPPNGGPVVLSGRLDADPIGSQAPTASKLVELWGGPVGAAPTRLGASLTGSGGTFSFTVKPTVSSVYQVRHPADANTEPSTSPSVTLTVPRLVAALAPTFVNDIGVVSGRYTIPTRAGVRYLVGGVVKAAGTYQAGSSVIVSAQATSGYQLSGTASWSKKFVMISPFVDVATTRSTYTQINYLWRTGVAPGSVVSGKRYFYPSSTISREQMALHLYRLAGSPAYTPPRTSPFVDVSTRSSSYKAITWFYARGASGSWIVSGKRYFKPSTAVARNLMAYHIYKLAGSPYYVAPRTSPFADMTPKSPYYKELAWAYSKGELGVWTSSGRRYMKPTTNLIREQMAVAMYKAKTAKLLR